MRTDTYARQDISKYTRMRPQLEHETNLPPSSEYLGPSRIPVKLTRPEYHLVYSRVLDGRKETRQGQLGTRKSDSEGLANPFFYAKCGFEKSYRKRNKNVVVRKIENNKHCNLTTYEKFFLPRIFTPAYCGNPCYLEATRIGEVPLRSPSPDRAATAQSRREAPRIRL